MVSRAASWVLGAVVAVAAADACAQSNLDAGKSPAQLFSNTCNACHRSPRELKPSSAGFLREHYMTGGREAAAMAAYLASIGSDPKAVQQRKPPTLGAGREPPPTETAAQPAQPQGPQPPQTVPPGLEQSKPPETQVAVPAAPQGHRTPAEQTRPPGAPAPAPVLAAARPRRPSESVESGRVPPSPAGAEAFAAQAAAAPAAKPDEIEE
jgi:hypothetical protein